VCACAAASAAGLTRQGLKRLLTLSVCVYVSVCTSIGVHAALLERLLDLSVCVHEHVCACSVAVTSAHPVHLCACVCVSTCMRL
jgi:hypothetical protein